MALDIFYPNGRVQAVQVFVWDGAEPVLWDGTVIATFSGTIGTVAQGAAGVDPWPVLASIDTTGLATDTNQTNGSQKSQIVDGSGNVIGSIGNALQVNLKTSSIALPVSLESSSIYNGTTALTPKFAKIAASSSGNNNLVAAVTSKKIRVLAYNFIANGTVNAKFQSDGLGTPVDLTGLKYCVANMGLCAPFNPLGWFESGSGKTLDINLSGGIAIGGELVYAEV